MTRVHINYPAPPGECFATDAFEAQRGNWPPLTDENGRPIGDVVDIRVASGGAYAVITAELYPSIGDHDDGTEQPGIEHTP